MPAPDHQPLTRAGDRVWGSVPGAGGTPEPPPPHAEVVVVGAGITGLTTAVLLRRAGVDVLLLEAREVAAGTTGGSTGKVTVLQGSHVQEIRSRHGDEVTGTYVALSLAAQQWVAKQVGDEPGVAAWRPAVTYATSGAGRRTLEKEVAALATGGVTPVWDDRCPELPYPVTGAIRLDEQLQLDPVAYLRLLAAETRRPAAPGEGTVRLLTGWRVRTVSQGAPATLQVTGHGQEVEVRAGRVVVATLLPFLDRGLLFARSEPTRSWCLAARLRAPAPRGMYLGVDAPLRSLRTGTDDDELVVGGNSHVTGRGGPTSERLTDLDRWARRHFDVERVTAAWAAQDYTTADRLPWVGPLLPTTDRVLGAAGFSKWGMTGGTAAAMQLAAHVLGTSTQWPWHPWRSTPVTQAVGSARINAGVALRLHSGWVRGLGRPATAGPPAEGTGRVERNGRRLCGISTSDGVTRTVSGICTHLGGVVSWNDAERSWDCPLHGSRFDAGGAVLDGPAVDPLT